MAVVLAARGLQAAEGATPVFPLPSEAEQKIHEALTQPTSLEFIETPLSDVVDFLKDHHQINIELSTTPLDAVGIGSDTPITRNLKGLPLASGLRLMLRDLDLTYVVQDDVLLITTSEAASKMVELRVYDVSAMLGPGDSSETLGRTLEAAFAPPRGVVNEQEVFATPDSHLTGRGGEAARVITAYRNLLLIRDNPQGHRQIARALTAIGQGLSTPEPVSAIIKPATTPDSSTDPMGTPPAGDSNKDSSEDSNAADSNAADSSAADSKAPPAADKP
ncbi:MAG: hypothetical protein RIC55_11585 [Pirellulaceae bacterium]